LPGTIPALDVDTLITPHMSAAMSALKGPASLLNGMAEYHLGWVDSTFTPVPHGSNDKGKRIRPLLAMLCCEAAGGGADRAAPLAAALELLHNFTLVHDDIQDHSPTRRHRPTVWALWGNAQAINAGDALFAAAHLALLRLRDGGSDSGLILDLLEAFDRMTIDIVAGQVQDLSFETRRNVMPEDYVQMITGKTAAIVEYAAWAGAVLGGAKAEHASRFKEFGLALGLGFQIQDDLLGIWGTIAETGKAAADDIRRKKQSYPILLLRFAMNGDSIVELDQLYESAEIDIAGINRVLALLDEYHVRGQVEERVRFHHDQAKQALVLACPDEYNPARAILLNRIEALALRSS